MDETKNQQQAPSELGPKIQNLRTYSSDMADAVRQNEMSVIKVALAEKARQEKEEIYKKAEGSPVQKILLTIGGIIFIVGGLVGAYFLYMKQQATVKAPIVSTTPTVTAPISYDSKVFLDASTAQTNFDIAAILKAPLSASLPPRAVEGLFLTTTQSGTTTQLPISNLLTILDLSVPGTFTRSLADMYMFGAYQGTDATQKPHLFILFTTKDYNQTYASMLSWEPSILKDLGPLFGTDVSGDRSVLLQTAFSDTLIDNNDARALYDANGNDVLYYMFVNKNYLVITDNKEALREIIVRLRATNTKALQ